MGRPGFLTPHTRDDDLKLLEPPGTKPQHNDLKNPPRERPERTRWWWSLRWVSSCRRSPTGKRMRTDPFSTELRGVFGATGMAWLRSGTYGSPANAGGGLRCP